MLAARPPASFVPNSHMHPLLAVPGACGAQVGEEARGELQHDEEGSALASSGCSLPGLMELAAAGYSAADAQLGVALGAAVL